MRYRGNKYEFIQQVCFYETNQFPSILPIMSFIASDKVQDLFFERKQNGSLEKLSNKKIKLKMTQKVIIAYGIARALEFIHGHGIVHLSLNPANIWLDSNLYPYLCEFSNARIVKTEVECVLPKISKPKYMFPGFIAPEFNRDYKINQDSFSLDVYAFGMILFIILTGQNPFSDMKNESNELPKLPKMYKQMSYWNWIELIDKCWNKNPLERPSFNQICDVLDEFAKISKVGKKFYEYKNFLNKFDEQASTNST